MGAGRTIARRGTVGRRAKVAAWPTAIAFEAVTAMKRGEVWWARLALPLGRRPVVLVSRNAAYLIKASITVAEISTVMRAIPSEVALGPQDGMPRPCVINADNLVTIPKALLESRITSLAASRLAQLDAALAFSLGLDGL
jgi:mRNA interferase MazF